MKSETVRYTATLPLSHIDALKEMTRGKEIPSVNFAINQAVDEYLKSRKAAQYESLMKEAAKDTDFIARTMGCSEDFKYVDSEISGTW